MNIRRLVLHNFLSYKDSTLDIPDDGIYSLIGDTGSGKSSIRDAITWGIFGKSRVVSNDELICDGENETYVVVEFEHNGKNYRVERQKERNQTMRLQIEEI
jgi:exonuclease SbcC